MDPTIAALIASAITGIFTFCAGFGTALLRSRSDTQRVKRELAMAMAKEMYDRQFWFAENQPDVTHEIKAFDYFFAYYMLFSQNFPTDAKTPADLRPFLDRVSIMEPTIDSWMHQNTENKKRR